MYLYEPDFKDIFRKFKFLAKGIFILGLSFEEKKIFYLLKFTSLIIKIFNLMLIRS